MQFVQDRSRLHWLEAVDLMRIHYAISQFNHRSELQTSHIDEHGGTHDTDRVLRDIGFGRNYSTIQLVFQHMNAPYVPRMKTEQRHRSLQQE